MSKVLARLVVLLGLATLISVAWFAASEAGFPMPIPRGLAGGRLYTSGPFATLQRALSRPTSFNAERGRDLPFSLARLWPGVTDNLVKMAAGMAILVAGWQGAGWLYRRLAGPSQGNRRR